MENNRVREAYQEWQDRQDRVSHPDGKFDKGGRWYPSKEEHQDCCDAIRYPSRRWPYSLMLHCRTLKHVARLYGVTEQAVREYAKGVL